MNHGKYARSRKSWHGVAGLVATLGFLVLGGLQSSCSEPVNVDFNIVNPCQENLFAEQGCNFMRIVVSALDPADPLHRDAAGQGLGPLAKTCDVAAGECTLDAEELVGEGRIVDVLCYATLESEPVARATSSILDLDSGGEGVAGKSLNLLLGNIYGFVETTVILPGDSIGTCSKLGVAQNQGRFGHTATLLEDGRVLVVGGIIRYGQGVEKYLTTAEVFDPNTGEHTLLLDGAGMPIEMQAGSGRAYHTATRLRDGRVLISGGVGLIQEGSMEIPTAIRSSELFDPTNGIFVSPTDMGTARAHHAATLLATGEVLVSGGVSYVSGAINNNGYYASAMIFNPETNAWSDVSNIMSSERAFHQSVLLDPAATQGKVIIIGGENGSGTLGSVDIFDPTSNSFFNNVNVDMDRARSRFCATRLKNGEVLVAGGTTTKDDFTPDNGVEIFNLGQGGSFGGFKPDIINLEVARMDHSCNLLDSGNVMVAGGRLSGGEATGVGELVVVGADSYTVQRLSDSVNPPRFLHQATELLNGWVLLTGGLPNDAVAEMAVMQSMYFVPKPL